MIIFKHSKDIDKHIVKVQKKGCSVGFVPTMGALHSGHLSLLKAARLHTGFTVCSIFVNPTQFNDPTDFEKYPVTIEADIGLLADACCDVLFLPSVSEMYPNGTQDKHPVNFGFIADTLEGEHRPGHFAGMAQIVEKLLRIVHPDQLFMGQKDYQQQLIVRQLIRQKRFRTELVMCPTIREKEGLAMSSRNTRLKGDSRETAAAISRILKEIRKAVLTTKRPVAELEQLGWQKLQQEPGITPEYFVIRHAATLRPVKSRSEKMIALVAAQVGGVRLIDNMLLS